MGNPIIKLGGQYLIWSSISDAPNTYGMTRHELEEHIREEHGRNGLRDLADRMVRVDAKGTSSHDDDSAETTVSGNRAGENETCLTVEQIVEFYVVRKGKGQKPMGGECCCWCGKIVALEVAQYAADGGDSACPECAAEGVLAP